MQIAGDVCELVGIVRFLVCALTLDPHTRMIFLSRTVSASVPGNHLDKKVCAYLRALSKGKAYNRASPEKHGRSGANAQMLHKWKVLPARAEIAIKRVKWWQAVTEHNHAHLPTMAAVW